MVADGKQASKKVVPLENRKNLSQRDAHLPEFSPSMPTALVALLITLRSIIRSRVDLSLCVPADTPQTRSSNMRCCRDRLSRPCWITALTNHNIVE